MNRQQRAFLRHAAEHHWISAEFFVGARKPWGGAPVTLSSASSVLRRLEAQGLLERHPSTPGLFRITAAGRERLS